MFSSNTSAVSADAVFVEEVFQTHLYTGNGSTQTITNGIDLSTKGGMVWIKSRSAATNNFLFDTNRGTTNELNSNRTDAQALLANSLTAFNADGFSIGGATGIGVNAATYASWTFREQAKFFDVVTYTGNGATSRDIAHNLGATPGFIVVKCVSATGDWPVSHRSVATYGELNGSGSFASTTFYGHPQVSNSNSTTFRVVTGTSSASNVNANGVTYVAYLFAHDAGGFGLTGTDNVISCGSYTGNGSATGPIVTLGYEPQWLLIRRSSAAGSWWLVDIMRGFNVPQTSLELSPNSSSAEAADYAGGFPVRPLATGFQPYSADNGVNGNGDTYIYIAIRRGPMKTPTTGTSVFSPVARAGTGAAATVNAGFTVDKAITWDRSAGAGRPRVFDRLRGALNEITPNTTDSESSLPSSLTAFDSNVGYSLGTDGNVNGSGFNYINYAFRRAPGFFDVVCYTGTSTNRTVTHNLGVAPELIIAKRRDIAASWEVYAAPIGNTQTLILDSTDASANYSSWNSTTPTSTVFTLGAVGPNANGNTYVAYLFASCPGVSKVGSYTGTGALQTINCGFTGGARFVLIKRTDSTGDWYVWDSARGIVSGNDPYLRFNVLAAEVTNTDYIDTYSAGFEISSTAPAAINANGGTFVFLAVA